MWSLECINFFPVCFWYVTEGSSQHPQPSSAQLLLTLSLFSQSNGSAFSFLLVHSHKETTPSWLWLLYQYSVCVYGTSHTYISLAPPMHLSKSKQWGIFAYLPSLALHGAESLCRFTVKDLLNHEFFAEGVKVEVMTPPEKEQPMQVLLRDQYISVNWSGSILVHLSKLLLVRDSYSISPWTIVRINSTFR